MKRETPSTEDHPYPATEALLKQGHLKISSESDDVLVVEGLISSVVRQLDVIVRHVEHNPHQVVRWVHLGGLRVDAAGQLVPVNIGNDNRLTWDDFKSGRWAKNVSFDAQ